MRKERSCDLKVYIPNSLSEQIADLDAWDESLFRTELNKFISGLKAIGFLSQNVSTEGPLIVFDKNSSNRPFLKCREIKDHIEVTEFDLGSWN